MPEDFLWEAAAVCWTVRPNDAGEWMADWAETEPDPVPVPTIGRLTWHIGWWWSVTIDHLQGRIPRERTEISRPGEGQAAVDWLRALRDEWPTVTERLTDADLDAAASFPWQDDPVLTAGHTIGWVNAEMMKNAAEIEERDPGGDQGC